MEKKVKRWVEDWQKLPYISPYEEGSHIDPKSDLAEKWTVGVLHELLHLLVPKKIEKDDLLILGDCVGLRPGFKKVLVHHPGIFYVSNKIRTHTVVLREGYKRDLLVEKHPLMGMRYQYIHLMRKSEVAGGSKEKGSKMSSRVERFLRSDSDGNVKEEEYDEEEEEEEEDEGDGGSDFDSEEDESDDDDNSIEDNSVTNDWVLTQRGASRMGQQPIRTNRSARHSPVRPSSIEMRLKTSKTHQAFSRKIRNA